MLSRLKLIRNGLLSLFLGLILFSGNVVYASDMQTIVTLTVQQTFEVTDTLSKSISQSGTYELFAVSTDSPMPEQRDDGKYNFSIEENQGKITIPLIFSHCGLYQYKIHQIAQEKENYIYDTTVYSISVYVKNDEDGKLISEVIVDKGNGEKCSDITFNNKYKDNTIMESRKGNVVKTGDSADVSVWIILNILSFFVMLLILIKKKEKKNSINI